MAILIYVLHAYFENVLVYNLYVMITHYKPELD